MQQQYDAIVIGAWVIGERAEVYERQAANGQLSDKTAACNEIELLVDETNRYITGLIEAA